MIMILLVIFFIFLALSNLHIARDKSKKGFLWFLFCVFTGPLATSWLIFICRENIPERDNRIFEFYLNTLLKKPYRESDWNYQNRIVDELIKQEFQDEEINQLTAYVNAELEKRKGYIGTFALTTSSTIAFAIAAFSPLLSRSLDLNLPVSIYEVMIILTMATIVSVLGIRAIIYQYSCNKVAIIKEGINLYRNWKSLK